jgi:site-specific DNA recombinase
MIAAIYARKSNPQEGAGATSESVDRQIEHAREYAQRKGWTVDESHIYFDDDISGATYARLAARNRLVDVCEAGAPFAALVVSEQARLGRHMIESAYTIMRLADCGIRMFEYLGDREISVEDEADQAMTMLRGFGAATERRQTSRRVYDSALRRVRAGQVAGSKIFGYDNVPVPGASGKKLYTLRRPNPVQAAIIRRIFETYAEGVGSVRIARVLNAEGVPAPRPKGWSQTGIRGIVQNPIYRGEVLWGRIKTVVRRGRDHNEVRPEAEWLRLDAPELRLVPEELWERVQTRRQARLDAIPRDPATGHLKGRPSWRDGHSDYLLPGLAACAVCGGSIRTLTFQYGRRPRRHPVRFYVCAENQNRGPAVCGNDVRVRHDVLDHAILDALTGLLDAQMIDAAVDRALERLRAGQAGDLDRRGGIERELALVEHRLQRGLDTYLDGDGPMVELRARLAADKARKRALTAELERLEQASPARMDAERLRRLARERVADVRALLARHVPQTRQMLRAALTDLRVSPISEGDRRGFRFEGRFAVDRVVSGAVLGDSPGGQYHLRLMREFQIHVPPSAPPRRSDTRQADLPAQTH